VWTEFWDMHSGGSQKLEWSKIYIEAKEDEAISVFYSRFGRNPDRVTCTCCGEDYVTYESETLEEATDFQRNRGYELPIEKRGMTIEEYEKQEHVLVIREHEISDHERNVSVPEEGYRWV